MFDILKQFHIFK